MPLLLAVTLSLVAEGAMGAKAVALLGVLAATAAALRALGAGIAGLEPIWIVIVLGAYALGAGFGFVLGAVCLVASALLTGGVGPWLPFQMIGAAWVGLAAGLLAGRLPARGERWWLACFSAVAGDPLRLAAQPVVLADADRAAGADLLRAGRGRDHQRAALGAFNLTTSMGYDLPRAVLTFVALVWLGPRVLASLRRASRRAAFDARPEFAEVP